MKKCLSTLYYADDGISFLDLGFENDVNMYGTQAKASTLPINFLFENDVNIAIIKVIEDLPN